MEDTLLIGDHFAVPRYGALAFSRGDIVAFHFPVDLKQIFVKRLVGMPGDRIRIVNKQVYLNGVALNEPYANHKTDYVDSYRDNFPSTPNTPIYKPGIEMLEKHVVDGEVVVPANFYFALGDNRDLSLDSRYWGFVPRENIIGKPLIIYWSCDAPTERLQSPMISLNHRPDLLVNFCGKTRWRRTPQLIHSYPIEP